MNSADTNHYAPHKPRSETRIVVAMSGGVDSSVAAAMMAEAGYETIGITLQLYDVGEALKKKGACCAGQDIDDARHVCEQLGIPHYVLNYENLFKESVMDDFADTYLRGETPIPCVRCNQSVKFRDLLKVAKDLQADALVTGHYVRRLEGKHGAELHSGTDINKDQSYFLFATTQDQLDFVHFPLGGQTKDETRKLAEKYGLQVADKPDSQDICFVPNGDYASIVEKLRPGALDSGDIVHIETGDVLGQHQGIINYTIGQRRGLGIGGGEPLYVIKIIPETKQVLVGNESHLDQTEFEVHDLNWLATNIPAEGMDAEVKIRSTRPPAPARIFPVNGKENAARIRLHLPQKAISPGQACVAYHGSRVLGGGWITKSHLGSQVL